MKKILFRQALFTIAVLLLYRIVLHIVADTGMIAGIFAPGPHLPFYSRPLIALFILLRIYIILLPGIVLSRVGIDLYKARMIHQKSG